MALISIGHQIGGVNSGAGGDSSSFLLTEDGFKILQEDSYQIKLEALVWLLASGLWSDAAGWMDTAQWLD